jgi:hypothetical protein
MNPDDIYDRMETAEIEPSVLALGAAYAASLIGMIFWLSA